MHAETIDDVLYNLDQVIAAARDQHDRVGYFACLYRHVTWAVRDGIVKKQFEDGQRMETIDVAFANRYFNALDQWRHGELQMQAWRIAFDTTRSRKPIVMQHLFLAMNAHINLDLAVVAAQICPGDQLASFQNDFNTMNDLLAKLVPHIEKDLSRIWSMLRTIHRLLHGGEDTLLSFSMQVARAWAWDTAQKLAFISADEQAAEIHKLDAQAALLAHDILNPGFLINLVLAVLRRLQRSTVRQVINDLSDERLREYLRFDRAADAAEHQALKRAGPEPEPAASEPN